MELQQPDVIRETIRQNRWRCSGPVVPEELVLGWQLLWRVTPGHRVLSPAWDGEMRVKSHFLSLCGLCWVFLPCAGAARRVWLFTGGFDRAVPGSG